MTWMFCHPDMPMPNLLMHIPDRYLWLFRVRDTREILACVFDHAYNLQTRDYQTERCSHKASKQKVAFEGLAIECKAQKDIAKLLEQSQRTMVMGGIKFPSAIVSYTMSSDAARKMTDCVPFVACYVEWLDARVFSLYLRDDGGLDVAEVVSELGREGHRTAAGSQVALSWEVDAVSDDP